VGLPHVRVGHCQAYTPKNPLFSNEHGIFFAWGF